MKLLQLGIIIVSAGLTYWALQPAALVQGESDKFCRAMETAMKDQCEIEWQNRDWGVGHKDYVREDRLKDTDICTRMSTHLYQACRDGKYSPEPREKE